MPERQLGGGPPPPRANCDGCARCARTCPIAVEYAPIEEWDLTGIAFTSDPKSPIGSSVAQSVSAGKQLHFALVQITPNSGAFPTNTILSYTCRLKATGGDHFTGAVAFNPSDIAYGGNFPTVVLPSADHRTVLMHGSCRKLGSSEKDALFQADAYFAAHASDLTKRPQQLLFTGDQVYGDDVDSWIIEQANKLGPLLLGYEEVVPTPPGVTPSGDKLVRTYAIGKRADPVRAGGFTSEADVAGNHAIGFQDYMTLYLLAWSGDMWKAMNGGSKFGAHPEAAQRLMANVPTYMLCDDHEITDDWNIDQIWVNTTRATPLTRRILANALSAYALFQAWGNNPPKFTAVAEAAALRFASGGAGSATSWEAQMIGQVWAFTTPAPASVVCMDTRTRRELHTLPEAPDLLNSAGLKDLEGELDRLHRLSPFDPIVIVSPAPVFGYADIEELQAWHVGRVKDKSATVQRERALEDDWEAFGGSLAGFYGYLTKLHDSRHRKFVILAGDVHYSFLNSISFDLNWGMYRTPDSTRRDWVDVFHVVCSSLKNEPSLWERTKMLYVDNTHALTLGAYVWDGKTRHTPYALGGNPVEPAAIFQHTLYHDLNGKKLVKENSFGIVAFDRGNLSDSSRRLENLFVDRDGTHYPSSGFGKSWHDAFSQVHIGSPWRG